MNLPMHKQRGVTCGLLALANLFAAFICPCWGSLLNLAGAAYCTYAAVWIWRRPIQDHETRDGPH